ncbi:MAG: hypothetical protein Roseis2KO_21280 [Roseivirga sp.]
MIKKKKYYLLIFYLPLVFLQCSDSQESESIYISSLELSNIKDLVLKEYRSNDSIFFSETDNCLFENFINNDLAKAGMYYDVIFNGILIKYYYCPYNDFYFNIVKGSGGEINYVGLTDLVYFTKGVNEKYNQGDNSLSLRYSDSTLSILEQGWSSVDYLNDILSKDTLFYVDSFKELTEAEVARKIDLIEGFIFRSYVKKIEGFGYQTESYFDDRVDPAVFRDQLVELKGASLVSDEEKVYRDLHPLLYYHLDKRMDMYRIRNSGLVGFLIEPDVNGFALREMFIPQMNKQIVPGLGLNYAAYYPDCN